MTLKRRALTAAGLLLAVAATASPSLGAKQKPSTSKQFRAAMAQAQVATRSGDEGAYQAGISSAATMAASPDEKYYLAALQYSRAISLSQRDRARKALGEMLRSGSPLVTDASALNVQAAIMAYEAADYKESQARFIDADRTGIKDPNALLAYADLHARAKRPAEALVLANRAFTLAAAGGKPIPESWYLRAESLAVAAKQPAEMARLGRLLLAAYPTAQNWRTTLMNYADAASLGRSARFDLIRVLFDRGALAGERDINEYADLALNNRASGEARIALDQGIRNAISSATSSDVKQRLASAGKAAGAEKAAVGRGTSASASTSAKVEAADITLANGESAKAAALYQAALTSASSPINRDEANLRLGIALARSGQKAAAKTALSAVGGPLADIAKFWILHIDTTA